MQGVSAIQHFEDSDLFVGEPVRYANGRLKHVNDSGCRSVRLPGRDSGSGGNEKKECVKPLQPVHVSGDCKVCTAGGGAGAASRKRSKGARSVTRVCSRIFVYP